MREAKPKEQNKSSRNGRCQNMVTDGDKSMKKERKQQTGSK